MNILAPQYESYEAIPDPGRTMEGLRDTGYSFETAVADLVDNSLAASAKKIDIRVEMNYRGNVNLSIADDGCGMSKKALIQAMTYGSPRRPDPASLGKFGLGLKTASTAFCRRLSVVSRPSRSESAQMATWDLDHVISEGKWYLLLSDNPDEVAKSRLEEIAPDSAGTVVLWSKVDRLITSYQNPGGAPARKALLKRSNQLKEHLAMTYQRFLDPADSRAQNVQMLLNGERIEHWDPFQKGISELVAQQTMSVDGSDAEFTVRAFILPRRDDFPNKQLASTAKISSDMQGIYIYREQRLIHAAGWLGMFAKEPHGTLLRVEFSFDHKLDEAFHLDIKKSQIILNESLWNFLKDQFLTAPRREANRRYRHGRNIDIANKARGAHDASNRSIGSKEAEIGGPKVQVNNPRTGEVTLTNNQGQFNLILKVGGASKPGEVFVQPADDLLDGILFEPALVDMHNAVRINTQHPYYHKVYVPNFSRSVTVQGMDSLLWALAVAELSSTTDKTEEAFQDMRYEVSRILRKLVEGLPEPEVDDDQDLG